ncbi:hypothetical protein KFK09_023703 [Dendrobium nobile]|uniref:Uncharacterized protein n=1 Tax=Dendrobium nobile TaxID=94219 RepID=A0A8T3ABZ9_DENNO|nr:hypothetical protein KFK09_023703 [Dendrobium nobile]
MIICFHFSCLLRFFGGLLRGYDVAGARILVDFLVATVGASHSTGWSLRGLKDAGSSGFLLSPFLGLFYPPFFVLLVFVCGFVIGELLCFFWFLFRDHLGSFFLVLY